MRPGKLFFGFVILATGALFFFGLGTVWSRISRPATPAQGFYIRDQKPFRLDPAEILLQQDARDMPITLFTLLDPPSTGSASLTGFLPADAEVSLYTVTSALSSAHPEATVREIRLQSEYGVLTYTVRFTDGTRYIVDADSGQTLELSQGEPLSPSARRTQGIRVAVPIADAIRVASACCEGVTLELQDARLEEHGGLVIYKVAFADAIEVFIDANTGALLFAKMADGVWMTTTLRIQPERALELARSIYPGQPIRNWKIVPRDGRVVYDVDFGRRMHILIDAMTGDVLQR